MLPATVLTIRKDSSMNIPEDPNAPSSRTTDASPDLFARRAGMLFILTAAASIVMVVARVTADADQPTLLESLRTIAENRAMYATSAVARIVSGITLVVAGWFLLRTWIMRRRLATPAVPWLLGASGAVTAFSGVCALVLAVSASAGADVTISGFVETVDILRWLAGKLGFALAGLALIVAARYQWKVGGTLRKIAPASAIIGVIMQFIWVDAATVMHPIVGAVFMVWLLAVGAMLITGRIDTSFRSMLQN